MRLFLTIFIVIALLVVVAAVSYKAPTPSSKPPLYELDPTLSYSPTVPDEDEVGLGYLFATPDGFIMEKSGQFSRLFVPRSDISGAGPTNFIYFSVVPKGNENSEGEIYNYNSKDLQLLNKLEIGKTTVLGNADKTGQEQYFTYERIDDKMIGGYGAKGYKNEKPWEFPAGTTEYRYVVPFLQATYLVGGYVGGDISKKQFDELLQKFKLTPDTLKLVFTSPIPEGEWKTYMNKDYDITFQYPGEWKEVGDGRNFPEGDILTLLVVGESTRPQSELSDGVMFSVMKPQDFDGDLKAWIKKRYEAESLIDPQRKPEYSQVSFDGKVYEKIVTCGLGCFTYYHIVQNEKLYGFVVNAQGPRATEYEAVVSKIMSTAKY